MAESSKWTPFHAQLHQTLLDRKLLPKNQPLLVAVSGGQDSLCLIKLLIDLQPKWNWQLAIIHCDHRWRSDSEANANYVENLAKTWKIPFYRQIADKISKSEAAARQWRYQVLTEVALAHHYSYLVTGHTASDRAETLLYNLMRGTGADGLSTLTWQRPFRAIDAPTPHSQFPITLVRPLLSVTRTQTYQFCQEQNLEIWEDSTNQDLHYARNRIRSELMPLLRHFNPQAELAIARTSELLRADVEYLEQMARECLERAIAPLDSQEVTENPPLPWRLNRHLLRETPLALQRRVMRQFLQQILPVTPSFEQVEKMTALINAPNRTQTAPFPGRAIAQVDDPWILMKI